MLALASRKHVLYRFHDINLRQQQGAFTLSMRQMPAEDHAPAVRPKGPGNYRGKQMTCTCTKLKTTALRTELQLVLFCCRQELAPACEECCGSTSRYRQKMESCLLGPIPGLFHRNNAPDRNFRRFTWYCGSIPQAPLKKERCGPALIPGKSGNKGSL